MFIIVLTVRPAETLAAFRVHSWAPFCLYQICRRRGSGARGRKAGEGDGNREHKKKRGCPSETEVREVKRKISTSPVRRTIMSTM